MTPITKLYNQYLQKSDNMEMINEGSKKADRHVCLRSEIFDLSSTSPEEDLEETEADDSDRSISKINAFSGGAKSVMTLKAQIEYANPRNPSIDFASKNLFQTMGSHSLQLVESGSVVFKKKDSYELKFF